MEIPGGQGGGGGGVEAKVLEEKCEAKLEFHGEVQMLIILSLLYQSELGYGKMETYVKLDKLGEVSVLI